MRNPNLEKSSSTSSTAATWPRRARARVLDSTSIRLQSLLGRQSRLGPLLSDTLQAGLGRVDFLAVTRGGRAVPVIQDLRGENGIQRKAGNEAVEDELVVHLLQGGVDATQAAKQVIKDGKGRQLARAALLPDGQDLRQLARDAQPARAGLEARHLRVGDERVRDHERVDRAAHRGEERARLRRLPRVDQDQDADDHVLDRDQARLAVRAEGEPVAHVVRQCDDEARRFQKVARERQALGRPRLDQLDDLRHLDDRRRRDDAYAERLRHREGHAFRVRRDIEVEQERAVARFAQEIEREVVDGSREV